MRVGALRTFLRAVLIVMPLLACVDASSQTDEVRRLTALNAALQAQLDSLRSVIADMESCMDPWHGLTGLDVQGVPGVVSSLGDDHDELAEYVMKASPSMGLRYDPSIADHLSRYTGRFRGMTEAALGRYARRYSFFRDEFSACGVPEELTALCIVESAVSASALSPAGAAGMWQLMPATALQYGLRVDVTVDERLDVEKSTRAAARFLRDLHVELRSWPLAVMAYNCGAEAVRRAQIRSGGSSDPWVVIRHLPAETQAYLPAFLAVSYLTVYGESREGLEAR